MEMAYLQQALIVFKRRGDHRQFAAESRIAGFRTLSKAACINMVPARDLGSARTKPISRRVVTTGTDREHVVDRRRNVRRLGG